MLFFLDKMFAVFGVLVMASGKVVFNVTDHELELTNELGTGGVADEMGWVETVTGCGVWCQHYLGVTNKSVTKFNRVSGKCACFSTNTLYNFSLTPKSKVLVYSYHRKHPSTNQEGFQLHLCNY